LSRCCGVTSLHDKTRRDMASCMNRAAFERVVFVPGSQLRYFLADVARGLRSRHRSRIYAACANENLRKFYTNLDASLFYGLEVLNLHEARVGRLPNADEIVAKARSHEQILGTSYNTLALANRHFGHGYALGGFGHPRSRYSEEVGLLAMLDHYNRYFDAWHALIERFRPTLIVGGAKADACIARAFQIPYRSVIGSRYENLHYWCTNEYYETHEFAEEFRLLQNASVNQDLARPYLVERVHRAHFERSSGIVGLSRALGRKLLQRAYWRVRRYEKAKGYYAAEELKYIYRRWRDSRAMQGRGSRYKLVNLADVQKLPFVFYPLHTEPETSVGQASPEYFSQLTAIASLSRDLPAGVLLAVKETIHGVGRRPRDFYAQIVDLKNVVLLDMMEYGVNVVQKATATATITGTAGFEAAVAGKPVITFGRHNNYNVIPHVFQVAEETQLAHHVSHIFGRGIEYEKARQDGARYLQAVINRSFDMGEYDYVDLQRYAAESVEAATDALERSLSEPAATSRKAQAGVVSVAMQ